MDGSTSFAIFLIAFLCYARAGRASQDSHQTDLFLNHQQHRGQFHSVQLNFPTPTAHRHNQQHNPDLDQTDPGLQQDYFWPDNHIESPATNSQNEPSLQTVHPNSLSGQMFNHHMLHKEYLNHGLAEHACRLDRGCQRRDRLNNTFLAHCSRYKLDSLLSNAVLMSIMHNSSEVCERILDEFIQLDELISTFDQLFKNIIVRYNCHNGYSVKWSCEDCKKAYKDWLCATSLPYYMNGERIKPCISFCERVEQRCPYLHPITKEQYGGQPVFICKDPNIPFVPDITPDIPYSETAKCYDLCHLSENITELLDDSLSKYRFGDCPDKGLIAEEVRNDPLYCNPDHLQIEEQGLNVSKPYLHAATTDLPHVPDSDETPEEHQGSVLKKTNDLDLFDQEEIPANQHAHIKKLNELKEALVVHRTQSKNQKYGHH